MKCAFHPDKEAGKICAGCGRAICDSCTNSKNGKNYCASCAAGAKNKVPLSKANKKLITAVVIIAAVVYVGGRVITLVLEHGASKAEKMLDKGIKEAESAQKKLLKDPKYRETIKKMAKEYDMTEEELLEMNSLSMKDKDIEKAQKSADKFLKKMMENIGDTSYMEAADTEE